MQCHAALIADISNTPPVYVPEEAVDLEEDTNEEWYGLEYTLELSRRDRRGSESGEPTSRGEHSKVNRLNLPITTSRNSKVGLIRVMNLGLRSTKGPYQLFAKTKATITGGGGTGTWTSRMRGVGRGKRWNL